MARLGTTVNVEFAIKADDLPVEKKKVVRRWKPKAKPVVEILDPVEIPLPEKQLIPTIPPAEIPKHSLTSTKCMKHRVSLTSNIHAVNVVENHGWNSSTIQGRRDLLQIAQDEEIDQYRARHRIPDTNEIRPFSTSAAFRHRKSMSQFRTKTAKPLVKSEATLAEEENIIQWSKQCTEDKLENRAKPQKPFDKSSEAFHKQFIPSTITKGTLHITGCN